MSRPEQARRRYDGSGRRAQAQATRERILAAARRLFLTHGFAATSIATIAAAAGVSAPTVFAAFKSKTNLLKEVLDTSLVGDAEAVALAERPAMHHVHAGTTATEVLARFADLIADAAPRVYEVYAVAHRAADTDPEVAAILRTLDQQRLTGAGYLAATVCQRLGTDDPRRLAHVRDTIWTLNSPLLYGLLVHERGWPVEQYRDWIARALVALTVD
jgi:AcrR family transcriptional regulator